MIYTKHVFSTGVKPLHRSICSSFLHQRNTSIAFTAASQRSLSLLPIQLSRPPRHRFQSQWSYQGLTLKVVGGLGLGLGLSSIWTTIIYCDSSPSPPAEDAAPPPLPPPPPSVPEPTSAINIYELSFGTVCGVCAGIFIKKGVKLAGFVLGGIFVILQYFGSLSIIRIDWTRLSARFENLFYTTDTDGVRRPPTVYSLWSWFITFLTADFQPRASFIAGLALGLRVG